ncbi:MAG: NTP transferase domain-containing protein [Flavobacteriales bacterium]|nr:NTP transferase domain-containing protein [Flavobacteriales bacterium]
MCKKASIILAGGHSSRMNFPKAFLLYDDQNTFIETILNTYLQQGIKPIVVMNSMFLNENWANYIKKINKKAEIIKNSFPDKGMLFSVFLGLSCIDKYENVFIHPVDQPEINSRIIQSLSQSHQENGVTIPTFKSKKGHPVLIGKSVVDEIKTNYKKYQSLKDVLKNFQTKLVEITDVEVTQNINTPEEYELWKKLKDEKVNYPIEELEMS